jgi:hypothetical protein
MPVIYILLDLTSWVDCKKCAFHLYAQSVVLFYEMHGWKFTQFGSAGVVFCLVFNVIIFSNSTMIANVMQIMFLIVSLTTSHHCFAS